MSTTTSNTPRPVKFGGRGAQAAAARKAAAAAGKPVARRGEDNVPEKAPEEPATAAVEIAEAVVPRPAEPAEAVITPRPEHVVKASDEELTYIAPPEDADARECIAHHRRRIIAGNRGLTRGLGHLTRDWVLSAGEHFWAATADNKGLKTAGYKSVEEFASSVDMTRDDVYRVRRAVPVYRVIGHLVDEPLNERTIRVLYKSLTDGKKYDPTPEREQNLLQQFTEMKRAGKVTSAGAAWARKLLELGPAAQVSEPEVEAEPSAPVLKVEKALKARRFIDLDLLKEAKEESPETVQRYVTELRERYEAAAALLQG